MAWLTGWKYRKSATVSRSSGAVTNYQMKLLVGKSSGATGEDIDCGGLCEDDFSDVRFTKSDGSTLLDYWIESVTGATPNQLATVWVEFDSIETAPTTFYMYYGNSGASAVSNGSNTFLLFDDFDDASIDGAKWTNTGSFSESDGTLQKYAANTNLVYVITSASAYTAPLAIRSRTKVSSDWSSEDGWTHVVCFDSAWATSGFLSGHYRLGATDSFYLLKYPDGTSNTTAGSIVSDTYYICELQIVDGSQKIYFDGVQKGALTITPLPTNPQKILLGTSRQASNSDFTSNYDWVCVRNFRTTEPAFGLWGDEEVEEILDAAGLSDSVDSFNLTDGITDVAGLGDLVDAYNTDETLTQAAGLGDTVETEAEYNLSIADAAGLGDTADAGFEADGALADAAGMGDTCDAFNWTAWLAANRDRAVIRYYCTLTGAADGVADVELPISSFQARKRTGQRNYLSVVIPGMAYADQIAARQNGEIVVEMAYLLDGVESIREEIIRSDMERVDIYEGTRNRSTTLSGYGDATYDGRAATIAGSNYKYVTGGSLGFRFPQADPYLNPGDALTVTDTDDSFTIDQITYAISARGAKFMEVREA